jgi:hypothetical protein
MIDEAWVTYADGGYFGLMGVLLRSLGEFSTRPVLVYGARENFDARAYPNVIDAHCLNGQDHIWTLKMVTMIDAAPRARRLIFLDADSVVNHSVDALWETFAKPNARPELPIIPAGTVQTNNPVALRYEKHTGEAIKRPMGGTCLMWFTSACVPFLEAARDLKRKMDGVVPCMGDEEAVNVILSRFGATHNEPLCTPFYKWIDHYLGQMPPPRAELNECSEIYYHVFHGCKDAAEAGQILDRLRGARLPVHYRG